MTGGSWYEKTSGTGNGNSDGSERTDRLCGSKRRKIGGSTGDETGSSEVVCREWRIRVG